MAAGKNQFAETGVGSDERGADDEVDAIGMRAAGKVDVAAEHESEIEPMQHGQNPLQPLLADGRETVAIVGAREIRRQQHREVAAEDAERAGAAGGGDEAFQGGENVRIEHIETPHGRLMVGMKGRQGDRAAEQHEIEPAGQGDDLREGLLPCRTEGLPPLAGKVAATIVGVANRADGDAGAREQGMEARVLLAQQIGGLGRIGGGCAINEVAGVEDEIGRWPQIAAEQRLHILARAAIGTGKMAVGEVVDADHVTQGRRNVPEPQSVWGVGAGGEPRGRAAGEAELGGGARGNRRGKLDTAVGGALPG